MIDRQLVVELFAEAIEVDPSEVTEASELRSFDTYDSIGVLTLIGLLEDRAKFALDPNQLADLVTVSDVCDLVTGAT